MVVLFGIVRDIGFQNEGVRNARSLLGISIFYITASIRLILGAYSHNIHWMQLVVPIMDLDLEELGASTSTHSLLVRNG